ncbi:O-antigen ligase family protein [Rhodopila globiformis]|uniref:O-antigen ligase-related domain-containing protein n=1 Tax=Rhodopila globiformis TaxID=1071 RepID=A0A2S6NC64_RHOGL|nr:O-antigen ligase family protein [Rhodopila globiformis]PPQ32210.1 hypothetical protein CCS01_15980 [Rhodopila globiformis]
MNGDILLACGLLLSTASQLRIGSLPIGPGELCLVAWLGLRVPALMLQRRLSFSPAFRRMGVFWLCLSLSLALGTLTGLTKGEDYDPSWFLHDLMAYPLLAVVACMMVIGPQAAERLQRVAGMATDMGIVSLCLLLALGAGIVTIPGMDPWFWERFRGWSDNPNQLAVLTLGLVLIALHVVETAQTLGRWLRGMICLVLAIWVGRLSQSDGCTFAMIGAAMIFIAVKLRVWLFLQQPKRALRSSAAWIAVFSLPFVVAAGVPLMLSSPDTATTLAASLEKGGGKYASQEAELRFALWRQALRRGLESAMLGLGPGPHLQMPSEIAADHVAGLDQRDNMQSPTQGAAANYEAHNTPLDLLTQGGLILVIAFFWLLFVALRGVYDGRYAGLTAMLCGLTLFSLTGLIVRHPLVWFAIAICLVFGDRAAPGTAGGQSLAGPVQMSNKMAIARAKRRKA